MPLDLKFMNGGCIRDCARIEMWGRAKHCQSNESVERERISMDHAFQLGFKCDSIL